MNKVTGYTPLGLTVHYEVRKGLNKVIKERYCGDCIRKDYCKLDVSLNRKGDFFCKEEEVKLNA